MTNCFVCLGLLILMLGCDNSTSQITDPSSSLVGVVVNSQSGVLLDSVIIAYKHPNISDTLVFVGDSVLSNIPNSILAGVISFQGLFRFDFALAAMPPYPLQLMFAYKSGYDVWRYDKIQDTVYHLRPDLDSLVIRLVNNG